MNLALDHHPLQTRAWRIRGLVQGVGFRPTVWRLARELGLRGDVRNDGEGVWVRAHGSVQALEAFPERLRAACPPLARIDRIEVCKADHRWLPGNGFCIVGSGSGTALAGVVPDAASCAHCIKEVLDPTDRRYRHPFANCTHCGPRLSIIRDIPYDRERTSMAPFALCPACRTEYEDPANRRFHAQPTACPECGPRLTLTDARGKPIATDDPIRDTAHRLHAGQIIAIKGIGGFQLACSAMDPEAIHRLRTRKQRPHKPFALMARDLEQLREHALIDDFEASQLASPAAPILLLRRRNDSQHPLPDAIAPGLDELGFMLPNTPLHHLLLRELDGPIVLTSGNARGEPQCRGNDEALHKLAAFCDGFLWHDRKVVNRVDDSVARRITVSGEPRLSLLRRARGYAPTPLTLPEGFAAAPDLLACGAEMKNTFCLLRGGAATLSQHIGDLQNAAAWEEYRNQLDRYQRLWQFKPHAFVVDLHPQYLPSQFGREQASASRKPLLEVQHHHAHVASCLADNGHPLDGDPVIGIAVDGLGLGDDGNLWGGEVLIADYRTYQRAVHFMPVPLPGGVKAMLEPWRNAWSQLHHHGLMPEQPENDSLPIFRSLARRPLATLSGMVKTGTNAPLSSSAGRLFDAVAAVIGIRFDSISYEGQAAIELEQSTRAHALDAETAYPFDLRALDSSHVLDPARLWQHLLDDLRRGVPRGLMAARFHAALVAGLVNSCRMLRESQSIHKVALSGGVMQNATLLQALEQTLSSEGFEVFVHRQVPANDGGLSLGQAAIGAARLLAST